MILPYVLIALLIILLLVIFLVLRMVKKLPGRAAPDYRGFFIIGLIYIPVGIALYFLFDNPGYAAFIVMGVTFLALGLVNRDKWKSKSDHT